MRALLGLLQPVEIPSLSVLHSRTAALESFRHRHCRHTCRAVSPIPHTTIASLASAGRQRNRSQVLAHVTEVDGAVLESEELSGEYCMPGEVTWDNSSNEKFTVLNTEVKDFPGLVRVVAWVLTGLELDVHNANLETDADGYARNTFWVTDVKAQKLTDDTATLVAERVSDFMVYCTPTESALEAKRYTSGNITIDNSTPDDCTVVTIQAPERSNAGFLLEVASAMTGVGVQIRRAVIQSCSDCDVGVSEADFDGDKGRLYKFWGTDRQGHKLDYARATALVYVLNTVFGNKSANIFTPNSELLTAV